MLDLYVVNKFTRETGKPFERTGRKAMGPNAKGSPGCRTGKYGQLWEKASLCRISGRAEPGYPLQVDCPSPLVAAKVVATGSNRNVGEFSRFNGLLRTLRAIVEQRYEL